MEKSHSHWKEKLKRPGLESGRVQRGSGNLGQKQRDRLHGIRNELTPHTPGAFSHDVPTSWRKFQKGEHLIGPPQLCEWTGHLD